VAELDDKKGAGGRRLSRIIERDAAKVVDEWTAAQSGVGQVGAISDADLRAQCQEFLALFQRAIASSTSSIDGAAWDAVREFLGDLSRSRAQRGFSPTETATFVFALKEPLFRRLRDDVGDDARAFADESWTATRLLDQLGLLTAEVYQRGREEIIHRQQSDMLELSTPVVMLWDGILALPMIGTLDSARTQVVMETLLQRIVETGAEIAIIDITGVPTVDTLTAQHLLKTVTAARLMGAEAIISGIRPQIAQTIVHLGVDLGNVVTKATLADAFKVALQRSGRMVTRVAAPSTR
jgi:rsbT co-antagonist protein RsbR